MSYITNRILLSLIFSLEIASASVTGTLAQTDAGVIAPANDPGSATSSSSPPTESVNAPASSEPKPSTIQNDKPIEAQDAVKPKPSGWKFNNEQHWLVNCVGQDIAQILQYAWCKKSGQAYTPEKFSFECKELDHAKNQFQFTTKLGSANSPRSYTFDLRDYMWAPENYTNYAQELMKELNLSPSNNATTPTDFLKNMSSGPIGPIFAENERIAAALTANPLDASLHEQAALVQTVFDMREFAGTFGDTRLALNRIACHLALAKVLRGQKKPSIEAQIAEVGLQSMSCRDGIAVAKAKELAKTEKDPIVLSFLRAFIIRGTGDYRIFKREISTPIEEIQFGLRYATHFDGKAVVDYIAKNDPKPAIGWIRLGSLAKQSVESGHVLLENMLSNEVEDFLYDYKYFHHKPFVNLSELSDELNRTAGGCVAKDTDGKFVLQPLSWDTIAAYHARCIVAGFVGQDRLYEHMWGVPDMAKALLTKSQRDFSKVRIWPLALTEPNKLETPEKEYFLSRAEALIRHSPELINSSMWRRIDDTIKEYPPNTTSVSHEQWFNPPAPMGTAYYIGGVTRTKKVWTLQELDDFRRFSPFDPRVVGLWIKEKYKNNPDSISAEQLRQAYGILAEFNTDIQKRIAEADTDDPVLYEKGMLKIAEKDPNAYVSMGWYFAVRKQPEKAAQYYEKGLFSRDDVLSANSAWWYINYLFNKGEVAKCIAYTTRSYKVYSLVGILSFARLMELTNKLPAAERAYMDMISRYDHERSDKYLCGFYIRNAAKNATYQNRAEQLKKQLCPGGLKKVLLADCKDPPKSGVSVDANFKPCGLTKKDVIVALEGYAVENNKQLEFIDALNWNQEKKCIIWNGTNFRELSIPTPSGYCWFDGANYPKAEAAH